MSSDVTHHSQKSTEYYFMKIRSVVVEFSHEDRRTERNVEPKDEFSQLSIKNVLKIRVISRFRRDVLVDEIRNITQR